MTRPKLEIQWPVRNDLEDIVAIYNQAIRSGIATGHTKEFTRQARWEWYRSHNRYTFPIYIMKYDKKIIGYGTLSPYREGRQAMQSIAEVSFFLDEAHHGKGYGSILLQRMMDSCPRLGIKTLLAILLDVNKKSVHLLKKFGFQKWGHFRDVVAFEDKTCGQLIYGLKIGDREREE
jgi:L-amino acid N-acyltransferase YncA